MLLRELWFGADFKIKNDDARYCFIKYTINTNECVATRIDYDEADVKINPSISLPFDTEIIFLPRSGETND